ncbi:transcription elongation factor [Schizothecium vesticola]|uniref:Transcription elongation factor n=1 Tax=Schizothecium vesticola TaxID=314040 RepID=A0AA40KCF4_9PEZI|nr:transcription elongation factor [Schizothecium vesticola]
MDDRELSSRIKDLIKALASEGPPIVIKLLEDLKKDTAPTEEQLRSTKAGVTVGRLRSNPNRDIARIASEIVSKWKKHVDAAKEAKKQKDATASPNPAPLSSPAPPPSSLSQPYAGDVEKRHFRTDRVDIKRTGNPTRDNTIGVLYNGLAYQSTESVEEVAARAVEVEAAMFRAFKGSENQTYRTKGRALFTALKRKDNAKLRRRVLAGDVAADRLVTLSDRELASEEQRARDEELEKENMKKAQVPMAEKSISDQLKCGKCGQKKVSYTQAQTRSADEPMTTFCECTVCGNRWKFS